MRMWLSNIVAQADYTIIGEAKNGQEAVFMFLSLKPDIMLLDITMPVKNGVAALSETMAACSDANVVMCFSMGQKSLMIECLKLGAKDFIVKPYFYNLIPILHKLNFP